jgi:hypothetical protein
MSILKLPLEIVSLLVELLNVEDVFKLALSCKSLTYILYDRRMCRLALLVRPSLLSSNGEIVPADNISEGTVFRRGSGGAVYQGLSKVIP